MMITHTVNARRKGKPPLLPTLTLLANTNILPVAVCNLTDQRMILLTQARCCFPACLGPPQLIRRAKIFMLTVVNDRKCQILPWTSQRKVNMSGLNSESFCCSCFVLQNYAVKGEGRRRRMSAVISLCVCIYGRQNGSEQQTVIWLREKYVLCRSVELQQTARTNKKRRSQYMERLNSIYDAYWADKPFRWESSRRHRQCAREITFDGHFIFQFQKGNQRTDSRVTHHACAANDINTLTPVTSPQVILFSADLLK